MHTDDVLSHAARIESSLSIDKVVAMFHDDKPVTTDDRSHNLLLLRAQIMTERGAAVHQVEALEDAAMMQLCGKWPSLRVRMVVTEPVAPLSDASHATLGYLILCMLGTNVRSRTWSGGDGVVATNDVAIQTSVPSVRPHYDVVRPVYRESAVSSSSDKVYDTLRRSGAIAATTANKYIETLRTIDNKTRVSRWPGGWLAALRDGRFAELTGELHRTWPNPHTYRHKISCILSALVHCRDDLEMDDRQYNSARECVYAEYRRAKATAYEKSLDNRMDKDRESKMVSDRQIDKAVKKATSDLILSKKRRDPSAVSVQMEKLWLLILRHVPAKRSDWGQCVVLDHHPPNEHASGRDFNYVLVPRSMTESVVLVLRDYKTKKAYGEYREDMPPPVAKEIRDSLEAYPRDYLFVDVGECRAKDLRDPKPFVKRPNYDRFARWVKGVSLRYFGVGATINDFRRRCVRDLADPSVRTRRERQDTAKSMLHSLQAQEFYRFVKSDKGKRTRRSK